MFNVYFWYRALEAYLATNSPLITWHALLQWETARNAMDNTSIRHNHTDYTPWNVAYLSCLSSLT